MAKSEDSTTTDTEQSSNSKATRKPRKRNGRGVRNRSKQKDENPRRTRTYPTMKEPIELDHAITRGCFDQLFDGYRSAFFHTTSILGRFGMEEGATAVHEYIIAVVDGAKGEIDAQTAEIARRIRKKGGPERIPRTSSDIQKRTAEVPAFVVRKYLTLFKAVDRLIDAIICAENVGAISWAQRSKLLKEAPKYLRSPVGRFHSLSTKLGQRQAKREESLEEAKAAIKEVLDAALVQHRALPGIEEKRPLKEASAGSAA